MEHELPYYDLSSLSGEFSMAYFGNNQIAILGEKGYIVANLNSGETNSSPDFSIEFEYL